MLCIFKASSQQFVKVKENISLKLYNTFGIDVHAKYFVPFLNHNDLIEAIDTVSTNKILILGGGSNILFTDHFDGLVLKNEITGIEVVKENRDSVDLKIGAGENWHQTVLYCIENGYAGIENLSLIPGNCGAAPMQNIGAYGVELKSVFKELEAFHLKSGEIHQFSNEECEFGYRDSIFKNKVKGEYAILSMILTLRKVPSFNTSYGAIQKELEAMRVKELSIKAISDAVINIRSRKLPDPEKIGNAGSFFKNPVVSYDQFDRVKAEHPDLVCYPSGDKMKLAAGWLIEKAGWKGNRRNDHGVHKDQALVLVNYGKSRGSDIYDLSEEIKQSVKEVFGVELEREVNVI